MTKSLQDGIVLDFQMNDLKDFSGNGYTGTATGTTLTSDQLGRSDKARSFNGSSDYISFSSALSFTSNSPMTIAVWINRTSAGNIDPIVDKYTTTGGDRREYVLGFTASYLYFFGFDETNDGTRGRYAPDVSTGWHFIVGTYNGGTATTSWKIYVDGVQTDTTNVSVGTFVSMINTSKTMDIGNTTVGLGSGYFGGNIGHVLMWNRELSVTEIFQLYINTRQNYQGLFDSCVAYWDFKGDAKDCIGGYNGTVSGATLTTDNLNIANSAYSFNGTSDYISFSGQATTGNNASISVWIKYTAGNDSNYRKVFVIGAQSSGNEIQFYKENTSGQLSFSVWGSGPTNAKATLNDGIWHHIVGVASGGTSLSLYVDGVLIGTDAIAFTIASGGMAIGRDWNTAANYWSGQIGKVNVWNRAITSTEIKELYDLTKSKYIYPYIKGGEK